MERPQRRPARVGPRPGGAAARERGAPSDADSRQAGDRDPLGRRLPLREVHQVVGAARLRVGAREVEPAERVDADERAGAAAVQVEVAAWYSRLARSIRSMRGGVDRARQAVARVVRDGERLVEAVDRDDREDRPEDLLLLEERAAPSRRRRSSGRCSSPAGRGRGRRGGACPRPCPSRSPRRMLCVRDAFATGPVKTQGSSQGSPTGISFAFSRTISTSRPWTRRSTMRREQAEHFCPWKPNAERTTPVEARRRGPPSRRR